MGKLRRYAAALLYPMLALACAAPATAAGGEPASEPLPYQLGQGLYYPGQELRIGGYTSIHYNDLEHTPTSVTVKDLSLFLTKEFGPRWVFFSEMEIGDALTVTSDGTNSRDAEFDVERLYLDYRADQVATLRLGKFLTPVGLWNLIHADPLVWTVSRPLTTAAAFSRHATGAMVYGSVQMGGSDLDYWLFADNSEDLDPAKDEEFAFDADGTSVLLHNNFQHATGGRLVYHLADVGLGLGLSYLNYELENPHHRYQLSGFDFAWSSRYLDLSGEAISRNAEGDSSADEYGGYIQAVVPLPGNLYLVGRRERYKTSILAETTAIDTLGINYRPHPAVAFKLEHSSGSDNTLVAPEGWLGSFAVLF